VIGIIFPVYHSVNDGIPLIVKRFIKNIDNLASKYIFAVCTNRGWPGSTIGNLNKLIRSGNGNLAAGFTVKMPDNSTARATAEEQNKLFNRWKRKLVNICNYISARKKGKYETSNILIKILFTPLFSYLKYLTIKMLKKLSESSHLIRMEDTPIHLPL